MFTSAEFPAPRLALGVTRSMAGKDRCLGHVFVARLWRTAKQAEVWLKR